MLCRAAGGLAQPHVVPVGEFVTPSRFAVNCSILFGNSAVPEGLDKVRSAGFSAVEFWWPFSSADPHDREMTSFLKAVDQSGLSLAGINLYGGDMAAGDRGVLSWPDHQTEFRASVQAAKRVAETIGCASVNALYGRRRVDVRLDAQEACALDNLEFAAEELSSTGATIALEALSGFQDYPLKTAADVVTVIERADARGVNVGMQLDVYHHWFNGDEIDNVISDFASRITHVQLADGPGRGAPGTGELPLRRWVDLLVSKGYDRAFALEFVSGGDDPLAGLSQEWQ